MKQRHWRPFNCDSRRGPTRTTILAKVCFSALSLRSLFTFVLSSLLLEDKIYRGYLSSQTTGFTHSLSGSVATNSLTGVSTSLNEQERHPLLKVRLSSLSCCKQVESSTHKLKKPFLPPNYRHSHEILKLIKVNDSIRLFSVSFLFTLIGLRRTNNENCFT